MEPATPDPSSPPPPPEKDSPGGDLALLLLGIALIAAVGWGATVLVRWLSDSFDAEPPPPLR